MSPFSPILGALALTGILAGTGARVEPLSRYRVVFTGVPYSSSVTFSDVVVRSRSGNDRSVTVEIPRAIHGDPSAYIASTEPFLVADDLLAVDVDVRQRVWSSPPEDSATAEVCRRQLVTENSWPTSDYYVALFDGDSGEWLQTIYLNKWKMSKRGVTETPDISRRIDVDLAAFRGRRVQVRYHTFGMAASSRTPKVRMRSSVETLTVERRVMLR